MKSAREHFSIFKNLTRIEQVLFGLPLIISGALLAKGEPTSGWQWLWIFPAFLLARSSGMAFNQWIDWRIDALNSRTEKRLIPSGKISPHYVQWFAWIALSLFFVICWKINNACLGLAPFAAFFIVIYSYMKRVHASCHFVLGMIHFFGPVMAALAIYPVLSMPSIFLGVAAGCSIAANDICYALQDMEFDRAQRLHSIPAHFGVKKALLFARALHGCVLGALVGVGIFAEMPWIYYLVIPTCLLIFIRFHQQIEKQFSEKLFFITTVMTGLSILFFIFVGTVWRVMF